MNKQEILEAIKNLSSGQGFYERLYEKLSDDSIESLLEELENQNFKDTIDLILYLES